MQLRNPGIIIDVPKYLEDLKLQVAQMGANVTILTFNNKEEIIKLPYNTIVNCTGLSARKLFNDDNIYPVKGHMIYLKNQEGIDYSFSYHDPSLGDKFVSLNPQPDRIIIGGSAEVNKNDTHISPHRCAEILHNISAFFRGAGTLSSKL